jgi:hypothetical protein
MKAWALAILLVAAALGGCISNANGGNGITAKEAFQRAQPTVQGWQADARLDGLAAPETSLEEFARNFTQDSEEGFPPPVPDANIGDGRATAWALQYRSVASNQTLGVLVYENGTVLSHVVEEGVDNDAPVDVAAWQVDSPRALEIAKGEANFSRALGAPNASLIEAMGGEGASDDGSSSDPTWVLIVVGSEFSMVLVNARTGERTVMPGFGFGFGGGMPPPSQGSNVTGPSRGPTFPPCFPFCGGNASSEPISYHFEGDLDASQPGDDQPFQVNAGHALIHAELTWTSQVPTDTVELALGSGGFFGLPGGDTPPEREERGDHRYMAEWASEGEGEYTAALSLKTAAPVGPPAAFGVQAHYVLDIVVS